MQFEKAVQALCGAEVQFAIIGGLAANFHGSAQLTFDLDICYAGTNENLHRLVKAPAPFSPRPIGFPDCLPFIWDEATLRNAPIFSAANGYWRD